MSMVRATWPAFPFPHGGTAPRSGGRRWRVSIACGAVVAAASCIFYCAGAVLFYRGAMTVPAKRIDLTISVSGDATVESLSSIEIKSCVRGLFSILEIVPDGALVRRGDAILRLDSAPLEEAIKSETVKLGRAEAALTRTAKDWQAAKIAVDEYREGTFIEQRLRLTQNILQAERRLAKVERGLRQNEIMVRYGFASHHHVDAMLLAVKKARTDLAAATTNKEVLENFTRPKRLEELAAKRDAAEARRNSEEVVVRHHAAKIQRLEDDLRNCLIRAPRDGMVVYANATVRLADGGNERVVQIYPGARVREYQTLIRLADVNQMQLRMLVPETKVRQVRPGQRARAIVLEHALHGEVASIADTPEMPMLAGSSPRQFAVVIAIDGAHGLKPGMTAEVEIVLKQKQNALVIPALCIEEGKPRVRVKTWSGVVSREVLLGIGDDARVEILDGVKEHDLVLLVPRSKGR